MPLRRNHSNSHFDDPEGQAQKPGHPFLSGNYAPQPHEQPLTPCSILHGSIPGELAGSQYVRNGGNPSDTFDQDRDAHWFDADGMLAGVYFKRTGQDRKYITPFFVNRYILTDVHISTSVRARRALLPSIASLINPALSLFTLTMYIMRAVILVFVTWTPFLWTGPLARWKHGGGKIKRISVANTSIWWHDRKALAGCESGPPIQVKLPELETSQWWVGQGSDSAEPTKSWAQGPGLLKHFREYTTAHPKVDPVSGDLMLYHMCFAAPFLRVSVIPARDANQPSALGASEKSHQLGPAPLLGISVPGMSQPKLMHDFACTRTRTIILDLPLSLDPRNLLKGRPIMHYDSNAVGRLGVFPRWAPEQVEWLDTREAFCVYHTANAWDDESAFAGEHGNGAGLNLLACRLNSATLAYVAGNVDPPPHVLPAAQQQEKCQLYYWRVEYRSGTKSKFEKHMQSLPTSQTAPHSKSTRLRPEITDEFALSEIPFEFPTMNKHRQMQSADYIYGTSTRASGFDSRLQKVGTGAAKIDCLVKVHASELIARGLAQRRRASTKRAKTTAVDTRSVSEILLQQEQSVDGVSGPIQIFPMPIGWYAQEATFVPRNNARSEDDGFLLFYAFDEITGLEPSTGRCLPNAKSELWILDARDMRTLVCRIGLPQRVPYGLHGEWFDEDKIANQELVPSLRQLEEDAKLEKQAQRRNKSLIEQASTGEDSDEVMEKVVPEQNTREPELRLRFRPVSAGVAGPSLVDAKELLKHSGWLTTFAWGFREAMEIWLE
ncbi:hypothetical protein OC846_004613 [Tilletia horrida]|uniref:Carotenoid oxygenase n=1 Tax=Tilletia horrida TaxID=155126 RepID=A0AAN6GQ72_9BASI|nr:hypothetical protein OC846_004613 [Tilletia horrida]